MPQITDMFSTKEDSIRCCSSLFERLAQPFKHLSVLVLFSIFLFAQALQAETIISNTATASYSINGNVQSSSDRVQFIKDTAITGSISLQKIADKSTVNIGELVRYTLTINNANNDALSNLNVQDTLPFGLLYELGTATFNNTPLNNGQISQNADVLNFSLGNIPENTIWTVSYQLRVAEDAFEGVVTNRAIVTSDTVSSNESQANVEVTAIDASSDGFILVDKKANRQSANVGDEVSYTITAQNLAGHDLVHLRVYDLLPKGLVYQAGSATINGLPLADNKVVVGSQSLQFSLDYLEIEKTVELVYRVLVSELTEGGIAVNKVQATSDAARSEQVSASVTIRTPSMVEFLRISNNGTEAVIPPTSFATISDDSSDWQLIDSVALPDDSVVSLPTVQRLVDAQEYTPSDPIVIQVTDYDQNTDPKKLDTVIVTIKIEATGDTEILLLTETTPDSGVFRGVIQATTDTSLKQNGYLTLENGATITVSYRDENDTTDTSATAALVVPEIISLLGTTLPLSKTVDRTEASVGELLRYTLAFDNTTSSILPKITIEDTLPTGFKYMQGSAKLNGEELHDGISSKGRSLVFELENMPNRSHWELEYVTKITAAAPLGKSVNKAQLLTGKSQSNIANATVDIIDELMRSSNILTGRVYIGCQQNDDEPRLLAGARIYMETGRSVLSDENGLWHMEGVEPGSHVLQLDTDSVKGYQPILCQDNTRHAGNASSQFVDLQAGNLWQVDFHVQKTSTHEALVNDINNHEPVKPFELYGREYLKNADDSFEILWPKNNYIPAVASSKIVVKSLSNYKVSVFLNAKPISMLNYDGSESNKERKITVRRWTGIDLDTKQRDNTLLVVLKDQSGNEVNRKTHNIHFSGEPASAELLTDQSILVADGKTTPVITLLVRDEDGFPMRANTHGYYSLENTKYQPEIEDGDKDKLNLNKPLSGNYKYTIGEGGIAHIRLKPTSQSGELKINLQFSNTHKVIKSSSVSNDKSVSVWLKPHLRDWILVGIAEGTLSHRLFSGNIQSTDGVEQTDSYYKRGRIAFFAKGRIKGKYLLTLAYDSGKNQQKVGSQLGGNIDPDAWYSVYADNSSSQYDAPSSRKLYVKLEKDNFYALFGDYHTDMNVTELATYERVLNGVKTEYSSDRVSVNAFLSEVNNSHQHREIAGDGSSGLYYLSPQIIPNSETIKIETRDRYHADEIIETRSLIRFQDYDIDYDAGTVFFMSPISKQDQDFNPNIIVADYESYDDDSNKSITAGGRMAIRSSNKRFEVGVSALHEGRTADSGKADQLLAGDMTYQLTDTTKIHAEIASSNTAESDFKNSQAYVVELEKEIANMEARLYIKQRDENFGINSQESENGTRKVGAELHYKIDDKTNLDAEAFKQLDLVDGSEKQLAEVSIQRDVKQFKLSAGLRHTEETTENKDVSNNTVLLGGNYTTESGKITYRSTVEKNIGSNNDTEFSPDRAVVGVDVRLKEGLGVFAEHETSDNGEEVTHNNRIGVNKSLWQGANVKSTYTQEKTAQRQGDYATLSLSQKVKVTDKIRADFNIDQSRPIGKYRRSETFYVKEPKLQEARHEAYTAFSMGLGSDDKDLSWTSRLELRNGETTDKRNFRAGVVKRLEEGKSLNAKIDHNYSEDNNGAVKKRLKLSLGTTWRPVKQDFILFNRFDYLNEESRPGAFSDNGKLSGDDSQTQKLIHNMHINKKFGSRGQVGLHHGVKYIQDNNDGVISESTVDTASLECRYDINEKWDVGVHGGFLRDWDEDYFQSLAGLSVGVSPTENAWLSLGYNVEGFDDSDFDRSSEKTEGFYLNLRYKYSQDSLDGDLPMRGSASN